MYKTYETDRLTIRPTLLEDAEFIFELMNSKSWIEFIGDRNIKTIAQAEEYIKSSVFPQFEKYGYSNYTIIKKGCMQKIGTCGLYDREGLDGVDIGFALLPNFQNRGFAFEASSRIKKAAFNDFGINELNAITTKENRASHLLLKKLGMKRIGVIKLPKNINEFILYNIKYKI